MSRQHHTKNKGDIGVLKAQCVCAEQGWTILIPISEHEPYDFVIYDGNSYKRVQAKYRSLSQSGTLEIQFKTTWADKNGTHIQPVEKSAVDLYAIYCPQTNEVYFIDPFKFGKSVTLRVDMPKNNQSQLINMANDFLWVP